MRYLTWRIRSLLHRKRKPKSIKLESPVVPVRFEYARSPFVPKAAYQGQYEILETNLLISNAAYFKTFINIGANAGWYSVIAAKLGLRTVAVEPDEINYSLLQENKKINGLSNLETHQVACSNEEGSAFLYGGNSGASLIKGWANLPAEARQVKVTRFDQLKSSGDDDAMIFVDVEGSELSVLQGMNKYLSAVKTCLLVVEITSFQHHPSSTNLGRNATFELLSSLGFQSHHLERDGKVAPYVDWDKEVDGVSFIFTKNYALR